MVRFGVIFMLMLWAVTGQAQEERKYIRNGNKQYKQEKFGNAQVAYEKAIEKEMRSFKARFNKGDALYKTGKYKEAAKHFENLVAAAETKAQKAMVYHNLGNALLKTKKLDKCIEAYKQALKLNPNDEETRYNLAYAQRMRKKQQQQQNKNKKQNEQNKQQKGDKQKQNKKQQNKQQKQQQQQNKKAQQQKGDKQKQQQMQQRKISKEEAKRLLKMLENEEKEVKRKVMRQKAKKQKQQSSEKEW